MSKSAEFTHAQASRLALFLSAPERPEGTMSYCELAGFLFSVACSPELVKLSEWLPLVFSECDAGFETLDEGQEILTAIMGLYSHINFGVLEGEPALPPGCTVRAEPLDNLEPGAPLSEWARGFGDGYSWLANVWDEYAPEEFDAELDTDLLVLSFFASRALAEAYREEIKSLGLIQEKTLEELADEMLKEIPEAMQSIAHLGRALYEAELSEPQQPVRSEKIGRNDPCPCGSGKKYKKCCGAALH
jgi:uncharacterized protein